MFHFTKDFQQQYLEFYKKVLQHEIFYLGDGMISIETLIDEQVLHPFFQLVFLDCVRVQRHLPKPNVQFEILVEPNQPFGIAKSLAFLGEEFTQEQALTMLADERFNDQFLNHAFWLRLNNMLLERFDGRSKNLLALSILMRRFFWHKKFAKTYFLSAEGPSDLLQLMQGLFEFFKDNRTLIKLTNILMTRPEERKIEGLAPISELCDGIDEIFARYKAFDVTPQKKSPSFSLDDYLAADHLWREPSTTEQKNLQDLMLQDNPQESAELDSERLAPTPLAQTGSTVQALAELKSEDISLNLQSKCYLQFIRKLTLASFLRHIINDGKDLKNEADNIAQNVTIYTFDIYSAVFVCHEVAEIWASLLKTTISSLIYPDPIYHLFEQAPIRLSIRTYDHPKRGNSIHAFKHLMEFESLIHQKFIEFLKGNKWPAGTKINSDNFAHQLCDLLRAKTDCRFSDFFFKNNTPQNLRTIKRTCSNLNDYLTGLVKGQSEALRQIENAEMWARFKSSKGLRGLYTFLGPSGVGKTHLAKTYADALDETLQTGYRILTLNMENYNDERSSLGLIGTGLQYTDSSAGELTFNVHLYPRTVLLFDEIEKAHPTVIQALLTLIDTGRLTDNTNSIVVDFSQCIVIFTSNLGHDLFEKAKDLGELDVFDVLKRAKLRNSNAVALSPEFVNRLSAGDAVRFLPLNTKDFLDIALIQVKNLDLDDGGLLDYLLDDKLAAVLLLMQLPSPTVRGLKAKLINLVTEAKKQLFSMPNLDHALENIQQLKIEVAPNFFDSGLSTGRLLIIGQLNEWANEFKQGLQGYEFIERMPLTAEDSSVNAIKINAIIILERQEGEAFIAEQVQLARKLFPEKPIFLVHLQKKMHNNFESVWLNFPYSQSPSYMSQLKLIVDIQRRLNMAKQKQQGFQYRLDCMNVDERRITFRVCNPEFPLQISSTRAEEGVTGLVKERPDLRMHQVVGLQRAKFHLQRIIKWLKEPELLASQNIAFPAGMLLAGPPGTGKTMLARALAGECQLPFISLSVGDLISGHHNGTATNIDRAFTQASDIAPCIMFIDEIDTIASARKAGNVSDNNAVNTLLTHLDGIQKRAEPIFVLAATNFPQALDPALLRAGRLDEVIFCDLPDKSARIDFFKVLSTKYAIEFSASEQTTYIEMTQGMSGAQIDKIFRDYLYRISSELTSQMSPFTNKFNTSLFREAIINVRYGSSNTLVGLTPESKLQVAWHEAGHLLITKLLLPQHVINFATIEPRNQALGFVSIQRDDAAGSRTASEIKAQIAVAMAGREAERLMSQDYDVSAGAMSDIESATRLAMMAVCELGLDEEFGQISTSVLTYQTISADLQSFAEKRIRSWLTEGQKLAAQLLGQNYPLLQAIAEKLYEKESLYIDEIKKIFHS